MGMAYAMLPWRGVRTGIAYGSAICLGLLGLLAFFPVAQVHFFPLTPVTAAGAMAGHWVYGAVLGALTARWLPPVGRSRRGRRRSPPTLVAVGEGGGPRRPRRAATPALARLSPQQLRAVRLALQQGPRAHGFGSDRWTLLRLAVVVERATGVPCQRPSELRALLRRLGWRPARDAVAG
jgi:hypothetical protein